MDTRPIGIFDSGLGGLTAVKALAAAAPWESFVYLGDTANAPYGDKTPAQIRGFSRINTAFLRARGVKALLVACNTSNANAMDQVLADDPDIPVIGVIEPAAAAAAAATRSGRIGVLATHATVASGAYERAVKALLPDAAVTAVACPRLVPLVESGRTDPSDPALIAAVEEYAAPLREAGTDTVILGCTHYPIIRSAISAALGPDVALVDSGAASVDALLAALKGRDALGDKTKTGGRRFFCSAGREQFVKTGSAFLDWDMAGQTEQVDLGEARHGQIL